MDKSNTFSIWKKKIFYWVYDMSVVIVIIV